MSNSRCSTVGLPQLGQSSGILVALAVEPATFRCTALPGDALVEIAVSACAVPLVVVTGTVVVIVMFVVAGSRHAPNQPHLRQVVVEVVMVSVVSAWVEDVVVLSS